MPLEFKEITLEDKSTIESYTKIWNCENAEFSFAHMFMWGKGGKIMFAEKNDTLYIKLDFPEEKPFLFPPFPNNKNCDYKEAVELGLKYLEALSLPPIFRSVSEPFYSMMKASGEDFTYMPAHNNFDYVYLSSDLINLAGKKYHGKRNHIKQLITLYPDYEYEDLRPEMLDECMSLYGDWRESHNESTIEQYDEKGSVYRAVKYMDMLNLTGGVIRIDGQMKAFTVGERILPDMHQIHIEKAAVDIDGLYPVINKEYASHKCADATFINREEDMGLDGLRRAKKSYKPVRMVEKYNVVPSSEKKLIIETQKEESLV